MEYLPNGYTLEIPAGVFPLSTDSMVLADFVKLPKNAKAADLGSGCAALGLMLCSRDESCTVTGFELDEAAQLGALHNIAANALEGRVCSIPGDLRQTTQDFAAGSFDICVSNPPYFTGGPASALPGARRDDTCTCAELMQAAGHLLKFGGDFFLVHKPEKLAQLIAEGAKHHLEAKELVLVRHRSGGKIAFILLKLRKGAASGLQIREMDLTDSQGNYTDDYRRIYHID